MVSRTLEAAILSRMRSPVTSRSNCANDSSTLSLGPVSGRACAAGARSKSCALRGWSSRVHRIRTFSPLRWLGLLIPDGLRTGHMFRLGFNNYDSSAKPLEKLAKKFERFKIVDRTVPLSSE